MIGLLSFGPGSLLFPTASVISLSQVDLADDEPGFNPPSPDVSTPAEESGIDHHLTVFGSVRIPSAEAWKVFANLAEREKHGPYKFVMVRGAGLFVGLSHREISRGAREENHHTDIAQGAPADLVLAAGYFMVGRLGEFVVTSIPSTRYLHAKTGEQFIDSLETYFGGEVVVVPLKEMPQSVREEFERGLMAAADFKPRNR